MSGNEMKDIDCVVEKSTQAIFFMSEKKVNSPTDTCIRCGRCVSACPMRLEPVYLAHFSKSNKKNLCIKYNIESCIECGSCAYVCPGNVPILKYIRQAKENLKQKT